jgi:hypothetical protein
MVRAASRRAASEADMAPRNWRTACWVDAAGRRMCAGSTNAASHSDAVVRRFLLRAAGGTACRRGELENIEERHGRFREFDIDWSRRA